MSYLDLYKTIRKKILTDLQDNLAPDLFYHCLNHTLDVEMQAERIALNEEMRNEEDLFLLRIACLYHDAGFMVRYNEHELAGCNIVRNELPSFDLSEKQIDVICGLIMATKIPQSPQNKLEEIICDADLDYLGRDDFWPISTDLFNELKVRDIVNTEQAWNQIQVNFFKQHKYFTQTNQELRAHKKQMHLEEIESLLKN